MLLSSNTGKTYKIAVVPSEFTSNIAEFGNPMFRLESLKPKEDDKEKLPAGYTRVDWIAGLGDALIDTGYYPNHNSEILIDRSGLMDYAFEGFGCGSARSSSTEGYMVMGSAYSDLEIIVCVFGVLSNTSAAMFPAPHNAIEWDPSEGENPFEGYEAEIAETRYSIYMSKDELRVGTYSGPNPATPSSIDPWDISFTLFGINMVYGNNVMAQPVSDMIYSFKVSENGIPVVNMLPCIEDATGQPGFYDTVRNVFITGEGMFFTGNVGNVEPEPLPENLYIFNDCTHYSQVGEIYPAYRRKINDWNYYLNNLQIGGDENGAMFSKADGSENFTLKSFNVDLPALTDGTEMFRDCTGLTSFTSDLPVLTNGSYMFDSCTELTSWDIELPNLTNGNWMFRFCYGLTSWNIELPKLTDGKYMFQSCTFTSWDIELPNLTDGTSMFWDCTELTSFTGDLPALTDSYEMFDGCKGLTSFTSDLPALANGHGMFRDCTGLTSWDIELPNLTSGISMFSGTGLTSWNIELPNLTDGGRMFYKCTKLTSWDIELPNLTDGSEMFQNTGLTSWDIELPNLTDGGNMFYGCKGLTSFNVDLPALTYGGNMFYNCTGLTSWDIDLPALTSGSQMFYNCTGLTAFTGDLPALTGGRNMFGSSNSNCTKLDLASVQHIANTIKNLTAAGTTGKLSLGIDPSLKDTEELETALAAIRAKGWTVSEMYRS